MLEHGVANHQIDRVILHWPCGIGRERAKFIHGRIVTTRLVHIESDDLCLLFPSSGEIAAEADHIFGMPASAASEIDNDELRARAEH